MESDWNVKRKIPSCKTVCETSEIKFANFILKHSSRSKRIFENTSAFRYNSICAWLRKYFCFLLYVSAEYWKELAIISGSWIIVGCIQYYNISYEERSCWEKNIIKFLLYQFTIHSCSTEGTANLMLLWSEFSSHLIHICHMWFDGAYDPSFLVI